MEISGGEQLMLSLGKWGRVYIAWLPRVRVDDGGKSIL